MAPGIISSTNGDAFDESLPVSVDHSVTNGSKGTRLNGSQQNATSNGHNGYLNGDRAAGDALNGIDTSHGLASLNGHANGNGNGTAAPAVSGHPSDVPIAICGMACRLPGGLHTPQQLWEFLLAKGDAKSVVPESRYNVEAFYDPSGRPGTVKTRHGYFLDVDLTKVDGAFSSFVRGSLERMDPHHIQMMEVARECLEDAGVTGWRGGLIGCYVGSFGEDWIEMNAKENQPYGVYRTTGSGDFMLSNHVSYELDLKGPSMTVRTACSAAMVALHEACRAVRRGDCSSAIVGGANLILAPGMTQAMSEQGVLSPEGSCKTFSADADGYGRGEAVSALYIKPLDAALRDGNPVRAIIKQTATNADGKTQGVSMPSTESHEALIRKAYELAGIDDFSKTTFVECHGTGTPTGDPIETNAVARVFGNKERELYIGSVKPNLGHSEGASGLTSIIKVVMALENRVIPPNIKFSEPNPNIPFKESNLTVPVDPTPWPEDRCERASINSFGIGGTNAHAILESARSYGVEPLNSSSSSSSSPPLSLQQDANGPADEPQLLLYSANSSSSLKTTVENFQSFVESNPDKLARLAYTLANGREHLAHRAFAIATKSGDSVVSPFVRAPQQSPDVVMVFTGQGAQWPAMGAELLMQDNSVFRSTIRSLDAVLDETLLTKPEWSIERELLKVGKQSRMDLAEVSQPLCTAVQLALVDTFASVGIRPAAVVGHSSGEIAAAYAAGALTAREAIVVAWLRGVAAKLQQRPGSMAAVGLGWDDVKPYLAGTTAAVACENSPHSVTISGDSPAVEAVLAKIKLSRPGGKDVLARLLKIDKAYHSYHMAEVGEWYRNALEDHNVVAGGARNCLFYSSVTGKLLRPGDSLGPEYWKSNLESPVLFSTAVSQILQNPELAQQANRSVMLEVGPHSAMAGPLRQIMANAAPPATLPYVPAMVRGRNCVESYLTAIGKLHQLNVTIDLRALIPRGPETSPFLPDLPRYAWDHEETAWWESRTSKEWRLRKHPYHELLGVRTTESTDLEPTWRNVFHIEQSPWVRDHVIAEDVVFPFAGYMTMAAEAARQITGLEDGYALRHVIVSTALVVTDGKPLELLTTLRPVRLTDSLDSQWWEFSIASHNGVMWTKHCTGQVRSLSRAVDGGSIPAAAGDDARHSMTRTLGTRKAYNIMQEVGLRYGPFFQALQNIRTGTLDRSAAAEVAVPKLEGGAAQQPYHLHPIMLDACLQILSVAATKGYSKKLSMAIPTLVEELKVYRSTSDVELSSEAEISSLGAITGSCRCFTAGGDVVLDMSGARLVPLPGEGSNEGVKDSHSTARYSWAPHVDFIDEIKLVDTPAAEDRELYLPALDEMTQLCLVYAQRRLANLHTELPFMAKYGAWIREQASRADASMVEMEDWALFEAIKAKLLALNDTAAAGAALAVFKILSSITSIFQGRDSASNVLLADDSLAKVKALRDTAFDTSRLLRQLARSRPDLRVLELEAGMGTHTAEALRGLVHEAGGHVMYSTYTFTDLSSGVVTAAKERFKAAANMQYKTLDISQPLEEQGFAGDNEQGYDVIIATNVMHATPKLSESLANLRRLLRPDGRVLLQEFSSVSSKWLNFVMGAMPRWWSGVADGRVDEPYIDLTSWNKVLSGAGLAISISMPDSPREDLQQNNLMIIRHADAVAKSPSGREVTLLCRTGSEDSRIVDELKKELGRVGFVATQRKLGDEVPQGEAVVGLLDQQDAFFDGIDEERYEAFKNLVRTASAGGSSIFWITRLCQVAPYESPLHAQVIGTARTLRSEADVAFATCEVDDVAASAGTIAAVFRHFETAREAKAATTAKDDPMALDPDYEYALVDNVVHTGRFYPFSLVDELQCADAGDRVVLDTKKPGLLAALTWNRRVSTPLEGNLVEVKVSAAGLNFRDVLSANGIVDMPEEGFGLEASGVVSAVGPDVKHLSAGDRVFLLNRGSFSTSITIPEELCEKIPDGLSLEDAATMPCVYATAIYSLFNIGRLQRGQSVLIHSACGGVGIAAIQLARMAGAVIYTTVGSEDKVKYLMDTFNIPRHHIFNSRDMSFVEGIKSVTMGNGVDLALNSLSGELLHATWRCIAEFGIMVEIGKRDLLGSGRLEMDVFLANRSYCCVDLDQLCFKRRAICKELLQRVVECYNDGYIQPVRPITVFSAGKVREAFRFMQQGLHMGKIVIKIRDSPDADPEEELVAATRKREVALGGGVGSGSEDASYLLVGGLGGLGQGVSRWLVERGAGHLVFLSRSAGSKEEDKGFVEELRGMGARVTLVQGDVCEGADVRRAVEAAGGAACLRGVMQMSMVLRDRSWDGMTLEEWQQAVAPKVQGTWNLHLATLDCASLDFFVLFSSISGIVGQPGQANYAAANTFLDSFARWRLTQGLPASAVDIGAVDDIGVISNNETLRRAMKTTGAYMINEAELLEAIGASVLLKEKEGPATGTNFVLGLASTTPLTSPSNRSLWKKDMRMAAYRNIAVGEDGSGAGGSSSSSEALKTWLNTARGGDEGLLKEAGAVDFLAREIGKKLFTLVLRPEEEIQTSVALADLGMDSLVAIEMRSWWRATFGFNISMLELLGMGNLEALAAFAIDGMLKALQE